MATTQENLDVADPVQAESDRKNVDLVTLEVSDQQPFSSDQAETETVGSAQADTEPTNQETVSLEQAEALPVSEQGLDSEQAEKLPVSEEVGSKQAERQGVSEEALGSEQAEAQPASEKALGLEPTELESVSKEPTDLKQAEVEPVSTGSLGPQQADMGPVSDEPVDSEPADREPARIEPVSSDQADMQPASAEMVNSYPDGSELVTAQPDSFEPVHPEVSTSQPDSSDHAYSRQVDADNAAVSAESQQVVNREPSEMGEEQVSSEPVDQQQTGSVLVHSEAVNSEQANAVAEPMSVDIPDQQPPGAELAYTHSDAPELVHLHPVGSELVGSPQVQPEFVNSHSFDQETHSALYNVETLHEKTEYVKSEHAHPEHMHTEAFCSDLEQQLQVSSELMHQLQVSSELVHMQPIGSEITHSQPVNSDLVHFEPSGPEFDNSMTIGSDIANMQLVETDMVDSERADPETQPSKRRKKKSIVWEHFTIENVGAGCRRACCKVCKQSFAYSTGSKVAGTSHLKRHIAKGTCPLLLRQQEQNQLTPYQPKSTPGTTDPPKRRYRSASSPYLIFDQDRCRHVIARMIIMHEYPLHMVEHPGFVAFVQNLQPRFDMVNFNTVQGDCVATYLREKQNLQKFIDAMPGRICLTLDMWTSNQTTGYAFLHGQFTDHEWKLHRCLLNVVMEPFPDSDTAVSHAVATCLSYWNLDNKLCSITFDQLVSDVARENMRGLLSLKNPLILNGQLLVGSCLARTLSDMARDVLAAGQDTVRKIRSSVKYVKTSDAHEEKFLELKQRLQVPTEKTLTLDNITKWNSTYDMLVSACELKEVFSCLDTSDPEYKDGPTMEDWKRAESIGMYLRLLLETANFLVAKIPPSTNEFFHEVWKIQLELTRNAASEDPFVRSVSGLLQERFLKYWRDSFQVLAIAVAMDPRFKMKLVEFSFTKLFGEEAPAYISVVDGGVHELFREYAALPSGVSGGSFEADGLTEFEMYMMENASQQMKSELDQYLDESLLPRVQDFDVLGWWKLNKLKYPALSKMARDMLSVPLSSVGPDYVFDTVGREMDEYRSSLRPETLEALMCAKDWLQYEHGEASNEHVKTEPGSNQQQHI